MAKLKKKLKRLDKLSEQLQAEIRAGIDTLRGLFEMSAALNSGDVDEVMRLLGVRRGKLDGAELLKKARRYGEDRKKTFDEHMKEQERLWREIAALVEEEA